MTTAGCDLVGQVRTIESPLMTDLVAAMWHLERIAETAGSPAEEAAHYDGRADDQLRGWVLANAERIQQALNTITAPYATTT
ncbi:hypothetical protein [Streptomyces sp. NPDC004728]|uniref:hypothetical protein n=1 Tax=Streptomyces sp. NPDC004728 TaxID=3154289 RepID=UPI0033BC49F8